MAGYGYQTLNVIYTAYPLFIERFSSNLTFFLNQILVDKGEGQRHFICLVYWHLSLLEDSSVHVYFLKPYLSMDECLIELLISKSLEDLTITRMWLLKRFRIFKVAILLASLACQFSFLPSSGLTL